MPKVISSLSQRLASTPTALKAKGKEAKTPTARATLVNEIWNSVPKPSRKYNTEEEQRAYWAGVNDERKCQFEYDQRLRDAGIR